MSGAPGRPGSIEIVQADWLIRQTVENEGRVRLLHTRIGLGEAEAIVIALESRGQTSIAGLEWNTCIR